MLSKKLLRASSRYHLSPAADSNSSELVLACPFNTNFGYSDMSQIIRGSGDSIYVDPHPQGTSTIDTADYKFYGSSVLAGTSIQNDDTRVATSGFSGFGSGNFTVEYWIKVPDFGSQSFSPLWYQDGNSNGFNTTINFTHINPSYHGELGVFIDGESRCKSTTRITVNTWSHVAIVKNGSYIYIYHNGSNVSYHQSVVPAGSITANTFLQLMTGFDNTMSTTRMQDLRIYVGVAKYTSNFTPPGAMFT